MELPVGSAPWPALQPPGPAVGAATPPSWRPPKGRAKRNTIMLQLPAPQTESPHHHGFNVDHRPPPNRGSHSFDHAPKIFLPSLFQQFGFAVGTSALREEFNHPDDVSKERNGGTTITHYRRLILLKSSTSLQSNTIMKIVLRSFVATAAITGAMVSGFAFRHDGHHPASAACRSTTPLSMVSIAPTTSKTDSVSYISVLSFTDGTVLPTCIFYVLPTHPTFLFLS